MKVDDYIILSHVHPVLASIVILAHRRYELMRPDRTFRVTSGFRTEAEQARLVRAGKSQTMNSAHRDGLAVDLAILTRDRSAALWDFDAYRYLNSVMQLAAREVGAELLWGGTWTKLRDGVHWQLQDFDPVAPSLRY